MQCIPNAHDGLPLEGVILPLQYIGRETTPFIHTFSKISLKSYKDRSKVLDNRGAEAQILPIYGNSSEVLRKCCVHIVYIIAYKDTLIQTCSSESVPLL
jgi:hypothetical protein